MCRIAPVVLSLLALIAPPSFGQDPPPAQVPPPPVFVGPIVPAAPPGPGEPVADLSQLFAPPPMAPLDQARLAGLPGGSQPPALTWDLVYRLALVRSHAKPPPRFERLDPARIAEQAQALGVGDFGHFRSHCLPARDFRDPAADFINLQAQLRAVVDAQMTLVQLETYQRVLKELLAGESFGLRRDDLDQTEAAVVAARRNLETTTTLYRDRLDQFKIALGLSPRVSVVPDRSSLAGFGAAFGRISRFYSQPGRDLAERDRLIAQIPPIGDCPVAGRAILAEVERDPDRLEAVLALAAQAALDHRIDPKEDPDATELRVRQRVRRLLALRSGYAAEVRGLALALDQADADFEQIVAPPAGAAARGAGPTVARLLDQARQVGEARTRIVRAWTLFQAERLAFDRDLGPVPDADWPSYLNRFAVPPGDPAPAPGGDRR